MRACFRSFKSEGSYVSASGVVIVRVNPYSSAWALKYTDEVGAKDERKVANIAWPGSLGA